MSVTRNILLVACVLIYSITQITCNIQYPNIDPDTGCPIGLEHKCEFCAEDQNRLGCYCESPDGDSYVTTNINTACTSNVDPCTPSPCVNGGTCVQIGLSDYKCTCVPGYAGKICNETLPKCSDPDAKCLNSECVETIDPAIPIYCQCYDGTRRDPKQNDTCPPNPCYEKDTSNQVCKNNGTCRIINNAYVCECTGGYAGVNCTKALDTPLCEDRPGVCGVGKCQQSLTPPKYSCNCGNNPSTFGKNITDLVKCEDSGCYASNPCQNGGTCSNKAKGAFLCQCSPRFFGNKCEKNSSCFSNPCVNGGTCSPFNETVYFCACPPYFTGQRCEIVVPDPCKGKNCGPFGECRDVRGVAVCLCSDGLHHDNSSCADPCKNISCGPGSCVKKANATYEFTCSCPVNRTGDRCEKSRDVCRETPRCGGGYCKPDVTAIRGYSCVCAGGKPQPEPCPFSSTCPIKDCGPQGICVETDGILIPPSTKPIYYVCQCKKGYISSGNCDDVLNAVANSTTVARCGPNGNPYPSRNPNNPIGCWCNNGLHIEEIQPNNSTQYCP